MEVGSQSFVVKRGRQEVYSQIDFLKSWLALELLGKLAEGGVLIGNGVKSALDSSLGELAYHCESVERSRLGFESSIPPITLLIADNSR